MNLAFANILARDETITLTEKMSGTTFKAQKIIAESILTETPELINTIISNPELRKYGETCSGSTAWNFLQMCWPKLRAPAMYCFSMTILDGFDHSPTTSTGYR